MKGNQIEDVEDVEDFFLSMAVFSAFIDKGIRASPAFAKMAFDRDRERRLIECMAGLMPLAVRLERSILATGVDGVPLGTVEQDVCEPFGVWYAEHCAANDGQPDVCRCQDHLADMLVAYHAIGKAPLDAWTIFCAARAEEPALQLHRPMMDWSINWEWAPRFAVPAQLRLAGEHPQYPRSSWVREPGPVHVSEYWAWVEHRIREAYVRSRYEAMSKSRHIFMELLMASEVHMDGDRVEQASIRRDLAGQEWIESLPAKTVFSESLFAALPTLRIAFCKLRPNFELDAWIGLPITDFTSEYATDADPDTTPIVSGTVSAIGGNVNTMISLRLLWDAQPEPDGCWRLPDGTVMKLLAFGTPKLEDALQHASAAA